MKRDFLKELGLEKDAIDAIMAQNGADIEHAKEVINVKVERLEAELAKVSADYKEAAQKAGDTEALTKRVEELEADQKQSLAQHSEKLKELKLSHAIETALLSEKAKNIKAARALIDIDKIKVEGDNIEGLNDQIKALKDGEDTKFLFENAAGIKGVVPGESNAPNAQASPQLSFRDAILKNISKG